MLNFTNYEYMEKLSQAQFDYEGLLFRSRKPSHPLKALALPSKHYCAHQIGNKPC